jgi:hypothetical protein
MGLLTVDRVVQVKHEQTRAEYLLRRVRLLKDFRKNPGPLLINSLEVESSKVRGWAPYVGAEPGENEGNEVYLFHGTSRSLAEKITDTDFLIDVQAAHARTFGEGIYLAEYVNHAQFFSNLASESFEELCTPVINVCRAFCGRLQVVEEVHEHTTETHWRADKLEENLFNEVFHSTMACEWPAAPNLREFVFLDDDQVLPEFLVYCTQDDMHDGL